MSSFDKDFINELSSIAVCIYGFKAWYKPYENATQQIVVVLAHDEELSLSYDAWNHNKGHRINVSGYWPKYGRTGGSQQTYSPGQDAPKISCSATRKPHEIAREIKNRFLPYFVPLWHELKAKADQTTADIDRAHKVIAELTGGETRQDRQDAEGYLRIAPPADIYAHLRTYDGERITWERFTTSAAQAKKIIELLKAENLSDFEKAAPTIAALDVEIPEPEPEPKATRNVEIIYTPEQWTEQQQLDLEYKKRCQDKLIEAACHRQIRGVNLSQAIYDGFRWGWIDAEYEGGKFQGTFDTALQAAVNFAETRWENFNFDRIKKD